MLACNRFFFCEYLLVAYMSMKQSGMRMGAKQELLLSAVYSACCGHEEEAP